jgi:lysophospholipase L1-like esterase
MQTLKRGIFICSIFLNLLFLTAACWAIHQLGGWRYVWYKYQYKDSATYTHKKELFASLPSQTGAVIIAGDSQVAQCEWNELWHDSLPILNRGIATEHIDGLRNRLDEILRHHPSKIYLWVGINDLLYGRPLADAAQAYQALVQTIRQQAPNTQLVLWSILPLNNNIRNTGLDNQQVQALNVAIKEIARSFAIPYMDWGPVMSDSLGQLKAEYTLDGLHLNGKAYAQFKQFSN